MAKRIEKAKIAIWDTPLAIEKTEVSAEIKISNPQQMQSFLDEETKLMKDMVEKIAESGANVVLCQKGIDEIAQSFMAKQGILAARRIKKSDIEKLSRATGGKIITNLEDLRASDLGNAGVDFPVARSAAHEARGLGGGVTVDTGGVPERRREGFVEPEKVKGNASGPEVEGSSSFLKINDAITAAKPPPMPKGQGPPP